MGPDFDRLRSKAGIDKLNEQQRKKLFKDFVEHGGRVIEEGDRKKPGEAPQQKEPSKRAPVSTGPMETAKRRAPVKPSGKTPQVVSRVKKPKKRGKALHSLKIYIRGMMLNVLTPGGKRFSERFIRYICGEGKNHLLDINLLTGSFLKGDKSIKKIALKLSTEKNSYFYEFLYRLHSLYDENEYSSIEKAVAKKLIPTGPYLEVFKQFFKKMYALGQYRDHARLFVQKAIDLQMQNKTIKAEDAGALKVKGKTVVDAILMDMLGKLHIALCRMAGTYYTLYSQPLDDFLGTTENDRVGYITRMERIRRAEELKRMREYLKKKQMELKRGEGDEVKIPKHVERGMPLLENSLKGYESTSLLEEGNPLRFLDQNDKMYETAILLEVFDKEYSFILTTGKVSFNIDYREQKKLDIKEELSHAYFMLSEAWQEVKDYLDVLNEMKKLENNLRFTAQQKNTMIESCGKKQSVLSRNSRFKVAEAMKHIETTLAMVINDYNTTKRLLSNPTERLVFDRHLDGGKKLENRPVIEAIVETFLFASSLHFLLSYGKLSGSGLTKETDITPE